MSQKLGWAVGSALTGWLLFLFGYDKGLAEQTMHTVLGERMMISLLPAVCCVMAFISMLFYPLSEKKVKEIAAQLKERHAAHAPEAS